MNKQMQTMEYGRVTMVNLEVTDFQMKKTNTIRHYGV